MSTKAVLPKGLSFPLKRSALDAALAPGNLGDTIHHVYFARPQRAGLREEDGRLLAEVMELPGILACGDTQEAALSRVQALALRVIAERLEHGEAVTRRYQITPRLGGRASRAAHRGRWADEARLGKRR